MWSLQQSEVGISNKLLETSCPRLPPGISVGTVVVDIFQNDLVCEIEQNLSMYADDHQRFEINNNFTTINDNLTRASATKASLWYESI